MNPESKPRRERGLGKAIVLLSALALAGGVLGGLGAVVPWSLAQQATLVSVPPAQARGERQWAIGGDSGSVIASMPLRDAAPRTHHGVSLSPPSPSVPIGPSLAGSASPTHSSPVTPALSRVEGRHASRPQLDTSFGKLPLSFERNDGQTDEQVKFLARGRGYTLFLTHDEAVFVLRSKEQARGNRREAIGDATLSHPSPLEGEGQGEGAVLRMRLEGSNPSPIAHGLSPLPGIVNYFIGNDSKKWRTNIPTYKKVEYKEVYPGIDLAYYGNQGKLEYDLVVAPGADPNQINLAFDGADDIRVSDSGDLILTVANSDLHLQKPLVYQQDESGHKQLVAGSYIIRDSDSLHDSPITDSAELVAGRQASLVTSVGLQLASYDQSRPLVIDPVLLYSSYVGGSSADIARAVAMDLAGNVYLAGQTQSVDFPTTGSEFDTGCGSDSNCDGGRTDVFVAKLNATGSQLMYATYLGGTDFDQGFGMDVDSSGNAYVTGLTFSGNYPTTAGVVDTTCGTTGGSGSCLRDAFVTKLDTSGSALLYSTFLGGSGSDVGFAITVDQTGSAYVTGWTQSTDLVTCPSAQPSCATNGTPLQSTNGGGSADAYVAKLNPAGSQVSYSTYLGGLDIEEGNAITLDTSGNAYVTGYTRSANFPILNPYDNALSGSEDVFVTKISPSGTSLGYSTFLGGSSDANGEEGTGILVDATGNAYVTGFTSSASFPTENAFQGTYGGGFDDAFVTKLASSGSALTYSTYLGGSSADSGAAISVGVPGNAYVVGFTNSLNFPLANPFQSTLAGGTGSDGFVVKLNVAGSALTFSTYMGGSRGDGVNSIVADSHGNIIVTGTTDSVDFPTVMGSYDTSCGTDGLCNGGVGGVVDAFVAKIVNSGSVVAWGHNSAGQIGDGSTTNRLTPVAVTVLPADVISIADGASHSLALLADRTVRAWGLNGSGQLGDGTTTNSPTPLPVSGLSNAVAIAGGLAHSLALLSDGTVRAWGFNSSGQLGDGTTSDSSAPVTVSGLSNVVALAAGHSHSLALLADRTVRAWGGNLEGELGDGTTSNSSTPVTVSGLSNVVAIAAGSTHSLALLGDGTVRAWGSNDFGGLGDGTTTDSPIPVAVSGLSNVVAIAAGGQYSLALLADGTVRAWGINVDGRLGDGTTSDSPIPVTVSGLSNTMAIAAGVGHGLALLGDGTVRAWGNNSSGQLGDGTTSNSSIPVPVSGLSNVVAIAGGFGHSLALAELPEADLVVSKTASSNPALINDRFTYTITVTNNGPDQVNVSIRDTLPTGATFIPNGTLPTGPTPSDADCLAVSAGLVRCGPRLLASGNSTQFFIAVSASGVPAVLRNTASAETVVSDPVPATSPTAEVVTIVQSSASPTANLQLTITDSPDPVTSGGASTYTMTVTNNGPDVAPGVQATGFFSGPAVTVNSITPSSPSVSCMGVAVDCNLGDIGPSAMVTLTVNATPSGAGSVTLTGSVQSTGPLSVPDPNTSNNLGVVTTTLVIAAGTNVFTVNSANDVDDATCNATHCSLREAINAANATANGLAGPDVIAFSIGSGIRTIEPNSALPTISQPVVIDGTTQPGFAGTPIIELRGSSAGGASPGLVITGGNSTVRGLVINRFAMIGIHLSVAGGNTIQGNYIGTDVTGTLDFGNGNVGIHMDMAANANLIGGTSSGAGNVIAGNANSGINILTTGNLIQGNLVGTNAAGTAALGNSGHGIRLNQSGSTIGGTSAGSRNLISGNGLDGIRVQGFGGTTIQGNFIGTNAAGTAAIANALDGVHLEGASNNTIGGTAAGAGNVISGNAGRGVHITGAGASGNLVQGNFIGTNAAGTGAIANTQDGVLIDVTASTNTIGGTTAGARNVISGNTQSGILISDVGTTGNVVHGNFIGTSADGNAAVSNSGRGVLVVLSANNTIGGASGVTPGGPCTGACNVISGNAVTGVEIGGSGATGNMVQGNHIGTNLTGTAALGNAAYGVMITASANNNTIGGTGAGAGNLISGNTTFGIRILGASTSNNLVQGNLIGTSATGSAAIPNGTAGSGVIIDFASNNTIGGTTAAARNVISGNSVGIQIFGSTATGNVVQGNFIGTNPTGTAALGNANAGVFITNGASTNTIGGTTVAGRNIISGNGLWGVRISDGPPPIGNVVHGNYIGTNVSGNVAVPNGSPVASPSGGIMVSGTNNVIGGTTGTTPGGSCTGACNLVSGNLRIGVMLESGATGILVQGNFIGTDSTGTAPLGNNVSGISGDGVFFRSSTSGNTIGGTTANARNLISGNNGAGIRFADNDPLASGSSLLGNSIGTDTTGSLALPNGNGVAVDNSRNNIIGGATSGARNLISGNMGNGIRISGNATGNQVQGNYIGTNAPGTAAIANAQNGVLIDGAPNNTIGGTVDGARNIISGHFGGAGLFITNGATGNLIQGNFIGTNAAGAAQLLNAVSNAVGVVIQNNAQNNTIGGTTGTTVGGPCTGACNVISGNSVIGVVIRSAGSTGNLLQGNFIGTNAAGTEALRNFDGVTLEFGATNNTIGGTAIGARNVISGNIQSGIHILRAGTSSNLVQGNFIGTNAAGTGTLAIGTQGHGILIQEGAANNTIGGLGSGVGNTIAFNMLDGIGLSQDGTSGNAIQQNAIYSNGQLGIDLGAFDALAGVTPNDAGDGDAGPNNTQNFPVLTSALSSATTTTIQGTLNSTANTAFRVEFFSHAACDASGNGEGQTFLGFTNVTTDGTGNIPINATLAAATAAGQVVTATATDPVNNTSEFSVCQTVVSDTTAPNVTINQAAGQADPTNSSPINFTVVFSEAVNGFATGDVTVGGTAPGTLTGTVTEIAPNNGTTYNVAVSGMTGSGTVTASLNTGVATDAAGNGNAASTSTDNQVTYDIVLPPPPFITSPGGGTTTTDTTPTLTGTAEPNSTVTVAEGTTTLGTATADGTGAWSVTTTALAEGAHSLDVTATDAAGNISTLAMLTLTVSLVTGPTFDAIPDQTAQASDPQAQQIPITGVTGTGTVTFAVSSNNPTVVPTPTITGTGATRTLTFQPGAVSTPTDVEITVTATDDTASSPPRLFTITVVPDEPPTQTLKFVNLDVRALAAGQATFDVVQGGDVKSSGLTSSVRGLALATTGGNYILRAPAGCTTCAVSLPFTVTGRCALSLP